MHENRKGTKTTANQLQSAPREELGWVPWAWMEARQAEEEEEADVGETDRIFHYYWEFRKEVRGEKEANRWVWGVSWLVGAED